MTEFDGERVRGRYLTGGYARAYERFQEAQSKGDPEATFQALFEALNWAVAIDEYIARVWSPRGKVEGYHWRGDPALPESLVPVMAGLRYVRARVHHQWADAVYAQPGAMLPFTLPRVLMTWAWRPVEELPTPSARHKNERARRLRRSARRLPSGGGARRTDGRARLPRVAARPADPETNRAGC
jgi:hypothetical protein